MKHNSIFSKKSIAMLLSVGLLSSAVCSANITASAASYSKVSNGIYTISTKMDSNKVLDVYGASASNGANLELYKSTGKNNQKFAVTNVGDGWCSIRNIYTGKALDVEGGVKGSGVNVRMYNYNGTSAQLWRFYSSGNGYYYIQNKLGYYMDVYNGNTANCTNVLVWGKHSGNNQQWKLSNTSFANGKYTIKSALDENMVVDAYKNGYADGTNIQLYESHGSNNQKFNIKYEKDGWYSIKAVDSGKAVDVNQGRKRNGENVQLWSYHGEDSQLWRFVWAGDGYFYIQNKCGYYLDVYESYTDNCTNIITWEKHSGNNQKWKLS